MEQIVTNLSHSVYADIFEMIMNQKYKPGDKIAEAKFAKEAGTSRTPVREALKQLSNDGLVKIFPNRYAQIISFSSDDIYQIGTLRIALDTLSVRLALLFGSKAEFFELMNIALLCMESYKKGDYKLHCQYDCDFHQYLATIGRNEQLAQFQRQLYKQVQYILINKKNLIKNPVEHFTQHIEIAQALLDSDAEKAVSLITYHLTMFYNLKERYPDGFFHM